MPELKINKSLLPSDYVSLYRGSTEPAPVNPTKRISYLTPLQWIQQQKLRDKIEELRQILATEGKKAYKAKKIHLESVTFSGRFNGGVKKKDLAEPTGLLVADIDKLEKPGTLLAQFCADPKCWFVFTSPGGDGVKAAFRALGIKTDDDHKKFFVALEQYIAERYGHKIDLACKNINRLTYLSSDPACYINIAPEYFPVVITPTEKEIAPPEPSPVAEDTDIGEINRVLLKIPPDSDDPEHYTHWLETGMSIHKITEASAVGLKTWQHWSRGHLHGIRSEKHQPGDCSKRWSGFTLDGEKLVGWKRLYEIAEHYEPKINLLEQAPGKPIADDDFLKGYNVEEEFVEQIGDENWAYPNLLIEGQITTLIGQSGSGKTTLLYYIVCPALAAAGYKVCYIDADSPITEYKRMFACAREHCFDFKNPDLNSGTSVESMLAELKSYADAGRDMSKRVLFFDTTKKFTDLMSKERVKGFFKLLRQLSRLGATIVLPGHANKHLGPDGQLIYEGTGDVMADGDNLIFLHQRHDGYITTTTTVVDKNYGAKTRGIFKPIAFRIDTENRTVELTDANLVQPWAKKDLPDGRKSLIPEQTILLHAMAYLLEMEKANQPVTAPDLKAQTRAKSKGGRDRIDKLIRDHSRVEGVEPETPVGEEPTPKYFEIEMTGYNNSSKIFRLTDEGRKFYEENSIPFD